MASVAVCGHGIVGSGVAEVLIERADSFEKKCGEKLNLKAILDIVDFSHLPYGDRFVKDFVAIENDPDISVVVECIGGATFAYDFVKRALMAGKSVVTSNKELIATKGAELLALAKEKKVKLYFEASVGGGVPIIRPMNQCLSANEISEILGIVNGTTNYILTKMKDDGISFEEALDEAFRLGYSERSDYKADVEGEDSRRKISILASLAFGSHIYPQDIYCEGITSVSKSDMEVADSQGYAIKLIAMAKRDESGKVFAGVAPMYIPVDNQLASVSDVFNGILINGDVIGDVMFYGRGAGKLPTASAIVADIIDIVKSRGKSRRIFWEDEKKEFVGDFLNTKFKLAMRVQKSASVNENIEKLFDVYELSATKDENFVIANYDIGRNHLENIEKLKEKEEVISYYFICGESDD